MIFDGKLCKFIHNIVARRSPWPPWSTSDGDYSGIALDTNQEATVGRNNEILVAYLQVGAGLLMVIVHGKLKLSHVSHVRCQNTKKKKKRNDFKAHKNKRN